MNYKLLWKNIGFLLVFSFLALISGCGTCHNDNGIRGESATEESTLAAAITSPSPDYTVDYADELEQGIDFAGSATGGTSPYSYSWDFGNGATSDLKDPSSIIFDAPGTYTIKLTVTDSTGAKAYATVTIHVVDDTQPIVISTNPERDAVGFDTHEPVTVTFSKDMNPESLTDQTFMVTLGGVQVPGSIEVNGKVAVFTPAEPLIQGVTYTATVTTGAEDLQGNPLGSDYTWNFTTLKSIAAGGSHTLIIGSDGRILGWGSNAYGQLGLESGSTYNTPQEVMPETTNWAAVSGGMYHSMALTKDGALWAWGNNSYGQLGVVTPGSRSLPVRVVSDDQKWIMVSAGWYHTLAIKADGSLWAWGSNAQGQLGIGNKSITMSGTPVQIPGEWMYVAAGQYHSLGIKKDGSLWAWGNNSAGQLGNNNPGITQYAPVMIDSAESGEWIMVAAGCVEEDYRSHSLAVKSDGSLWSWGWNQYGQLGDRSYVNKYIPSRVGNEYDWVAVSAGGRHSMALKKNGSLYAFGYNAYGQLGNGSYATSNEPVRVSSEWKWAAASAGNDHSVGLGSDGYIYTWGSNEYGQLCIDWSYSRWYLPCNITGSN